MSHFCLLSDPGNYIAHDWDFVADADKRNYWLDLFARHFEEVARHALKQHGRSATKHVNAAKEEFGAALTSLRDKPASLPCGKLNVIELCRLREGVIRKHRLGDPFGYIKTRENNVAAKLYASVVRKLHTLDGDAKWLHLVQCVFAGNTFDLGATSLMHLADESMDFLKTMEDVKPRPWLIDDFDALCADLATAPPTKWTKAVVFVDNAGSDFILGVMPLVRELGLYGCKIVLAANELPSLNDMTADETAMTVERLAADDEDLLALVRAGMIEVVSTGNDIPLIDLSEVSDELNAAAADADLVILEGMGRAVESNLNAAFTVDTLHLALLKDPAVAETIGGQMYDCVCKYTPKG